MTWREEEQIGSAYNSLPEEDASSMVDDNNKRK
jgi:hypothetical protein